MAGVRPRHHTQPGDGWHVLSPAGHDYRGDRSIPQHTRCPRGHAPATCCVAVEHERVELPVFPMAGANHRASGAEMAAGLCLGSGRSSAMVCAGAAYVGKRPPGAAGRHAGFHVDYPRRFIINAGVGDAA